jgi:hypothetical protein
MRIARVLLLLALTQPALARPPAQETEPLSDGPDILVLNTAYGMRFALGLASLPVPPAESASSIFTSVYWSRAYEQRALLDARYGIHAAGGLTLESSSMRRAQGAGSRQFGFVGELRWPSAKPLAGLQFERRDLLLQGDQLSIRATSDVQALFREAGLIKSMAEIDALSLLGWRSHSQLVWQIGEPSRQIQWQFSARYDRRAYVQTDTVALNVLRRF